MQDTYDLLSEVCSVEHESQRPTSDAIRETTKRFVDVGLSVVGGLAVLPAFLLIAVLIRCTSQGPVLYCQRRIGKGGRFFSLWKFRTMVANADEVLERCLSEDEALRHEWEAEHKLRRDPRITAVGRFLRKTSLDELPQVWNVLRGEMSIVGPRPIVTAEVCKYASAFEDYIQVRPGITGLWQVSGRNTLPYDQRVQLDTFYVHNWSLGLDLHILRRTAKVVLDGEGAY